MRVICFVVYDLTIVGGVEKVVESLANRLSKKYVVHIVSLHGEYVNPAIHFSAQISVSFFHLPEGRLRQQLFKAFFMLRKFFRINSVDVAFLEATFAGFIGAPLGVASGTSVVFCDHGALLNQINDKDIKLMRRIASLLCDHIVVLTKKTKEDYQRLFKIKPSKVTCIYNWINESMISFDREYNHNSRIIMTAGRFTKEKGYDLLLEVAKKVLPFNPGWQWHIYGNGPLEEHFREETENIGLKESIQFKGFCDKLDDAYKNASLYVLPSYREGLPLVLLEAKAYKVPCVSFDVVSGPGEIIENSINGYLINPYDTIKMAECVNKLIQDDSLREKLSLNSYSNLDNFREEKVLGQWENLINSLIKKG